MSMRVRLLRAAQNDYDAAVDWYEEQKAGLGRRFFTALEQTLEEIGEQPDRYPEGGNRHSRSDGIGVAVLRLLSDSQRACNGHRSASFLSRSSDLAMAAGPRINTKRLKGRKP